MDSPAASPTLRENTRISAVIFDLDGTLLDTDYVSKYAIKDVLAKYGKVLEHREDRKVGMTQSESAKDTVEYYGLPLAPDQYLEQLIPLCKLQWGKARVLPGVRRLISHLRKHGVPMAVASNSVKANVEAKLSHISDWNGIFSVVLGSDDVRSGKPSPDLFLEAAKRIGISDPACCLVIEDSGVGVQAAKAAGMNVVAVPSRSETPRVTIADTVLPSLLEFQPELWGFPPFEDSIDNALPVEHVILHGTLENKDFQEVTDGSSSELADQIFGLYIGWIKTEELEPIKAVANVSWEHSGRNSLRSITVSLIGGNGNSVDVSTQKVMLYLVGYLRRDNSKEIGQTETCILEKEKLKANAALDLPSFALGSTTTSLCDRCGW